MLAGLTALCPLLCVPAQLPAPGVTPRSCVATAGLPRYICTSQTQWRVAALLCCRFISNLVIINHLKLSSRILTLSLHACCASSLFFWRMQVVAYYIEQSKANNHAVREAACACIAELMCKASCQLRVDSRGSCILAQGVTQRLMKSHGVTNAGVWFDFTTPYPLNSTS
jgi:hypothetical protein